MTFEGILYYYIAHHNDFTSTEFIIAQDIISYILEESRLIRHISHPTPTPTEILKNRP